MKMNLLFCQGNQELPFIYLFIYKVLVYSIQRIILFFFFLIFFLFSFFPSFQVQASQTLMSLREFTICIFFVCKFCKTFQGQNYSGDLSEHPVIRQTQDFTRIGKQTFLGAGNCFSLWNSAVLGKLDSYLDFFFFCLGNYFVESMMPCRMLNSH